MYKYAIRWLCAIALLVSAGTARAAFHLWQVNEIYSNADGTVQFIELIALAGGQQFLAGHAISSSQVATTSSFTFPTDLPGDTQGRTFLIGTAGFAALGLVAPDYIVTNGFLFTSNGSVNFAGVDNVTWAALPVDGTMSINRFGATAVNSPKNFAGSTAVISMGGGGQADPADCLFNWAERTYPELFAPAASSSTSAPYYYRYYSQTGAYLGTSSADNHVYYLGPISSDSILDAGALSTWLATAGCSQVPQSPAGADGYGYGP